MQRITIKMIWAMLLLAIAATPAMAQDITSVRDINAIPQENIDALIAGGENLTDGDITANIYNELNGETVTIVVALLSDPRNSGLANVTDGRPGRVHMFVRDTSAVTQGYEGMGIQIVDGDYDTNNLLSFGRGEVLKVTGTVSPFGTTMQVSPESIEFLGLYSDLGLPDSLLDPVVVTSSDITSAVGTGDGVQTNWSNLADLRGQYVRLEGATLQTRDLVDPDRPDFYVSSDEGTTVVNFYDTGLQFRNDRNDYPDTFNNTNVTGLDDFIPPPPGSFLNLQGFLIFQGFADGIGRAVPAHAMLSIVPFERRGCEEGVTEFRCDLEVTETPPVLSDVQGPTFVPDGSEPITISFSATADPSRTITSGSCIYFTSADATEQTVAATLNGEVFECEIPAQEDGVFTTFFTSSTDNTGAMSTSDANFYRTLVDGINAIEDIQLTIDGGPGDSPFAGLNELLVDITATVQSDPAVSGLIVLQDNADLDAWSGITLFESGTSLQKGDIIQISQADVSEFREATQISNAVYEIVSSGNDVLGYKNVTTDLLQDQTIAEAHESMMLQFDNVTVTTQNADSPDDDTGNNFGEWAISSDGTPENQLRVDDASAAIPSDPSSSDGVPAGFNYETIVEGAVYTFHRGVLSYSFGNYKLIPESPDDIGEIVGVANEDDELPFAFTLQQNYPNPFNPTTSIQFAVPASGQVTLEVFDILGRAVNTLVDGVVNAGEHTIEFDAASLPSGMYLYRLSAGEKVTTKKMLLLK